jgi:sec-independent protein translocase protein TatC
MSLRRILPGRLGGRPGDPSATTMTLVDHLTELRSRLIKALLAIAVGALIGFALYDPVLDWLRRPYCDLKDSIDQASTCRLVVTDPLESFSIRLKLSAYIGFLIASPVVLWQLWRFITPGLYPREKRYAVPFVGSSVVLFVAGALIAIATFSKTLEFFAAFGGSDLELLYTPTKYLNLLVMMMLIFGLAFEFPVILMFLQVAHLLHWRTLVRWRRYAIIGIFVVGAVITPSGDPITLLALCLPMYLFYELSILLGRFVLRPDEVEARVST